MYAGGKRKKERQFRDREKGVLQKEWVGNRNKRIEGEREWKVRKRRLS